MVTKEFAKKYHGRNCTIDGQKAIVIAKEGDTFAIVARIPDGPSEAFTVGQVDNVMTFGGRFMSSLTEVEQVSQDDLEAAAEFFDGIF